MLHIELLRHLCAESPKWTSLSLMLDFMFYTAFEQNPMTLVMEKVTAKFLWTLCPLC